jgi:hypothetical protein
MQRETPAETRKRAFHYETRVLALKFAAEEGADTDGEPTSEQWLRAQRITKPPYDRRERILERAEMKWMRC